MPAQSALMNVMTAAARKAARSLKRDFGEVANLQVSLKGPANFVSAADHRAEEILRTELLKARPGYGFMGEEGAGFRMVMNNFNGERLAMSAMALGFAQACCDEALAWARERRTFGTPLVDKQVIRHKLVDIRRIHVEHHALMTAT